MLTYMSIRDEIKTACEDKRLFYVPHPWEGSGPRYVFASPEVWSVIRNPWDGDDEDSIRFSNMRAGMDQFSVGAEVTIAMRPHSKKRESFLAPIDPVTSHCWDMRFLAPRSNIRCMGFFAEFNCFIGLVWDFRENFEAEADWQAGLARCQQLWASLFTHEPHKGSERGDYISKPFDNG